ncbi:hypothetical protein BKP35_07600 [Anaerobacillus arseniciselenatis]|uniref:Serine aminopeptidase S33 domain-containing protein n=1 Tax=Anaerobacillus arseniciselenatis TaxID=85682 RepID=A0A1S2LNF2_9BACI|nr:alpha/beta fold hydrolase [Anaerobacillus arseniciselenatis]OIJ14058.1 hypothetical protein BKP35_07600 [Anaerobacillus arseniciselenatis]
MKRKRILIYKIVAAIFLLSIVITFIVNTVIANDVISEMSDVRVEINDATLDDFHLLGEQINVLTKDDLNINAYVVPNENSIGNIVLLHGMHGMDATSLFDYAKFVYDLGFTAISVDMRAHGKSEGKQLSFGYQEVNDVLAVIKFLKEDERFNNQSVILYGISMGASTAINTAAVSEEVNGIIAVSPFLSIQNQVSDYMLRDGFPKAFVNLFQPSVNLVLSQKFGVSPVKESPKTNVTNLNDIPLLIIHSKDDAQTALYQAEILYDLASTNQKEIWIVDGDEHLIVEDVLNEESEFYRERIREFLYEIH